MRIQLFIIFLVTGFSANAQIGMFNSALYPNIKNTTFYVVMEDTSSDAGRQMAQAIRSIWNVSAMVFIHPNNLAAALKPGNMYATLEHSQFSLQFVRENIGTGQEWRSDKVNNDYFYINFWILKDNYSKDKELGQKNKQTIARAELYLKSIGTGQIIESSRTISSRSFNYDYCNGLPGFIKNIFQQVNNNISNGIETKLKKDMKALPELAQLQKDTLYVPNYWYGPGGTMLPDEPENSANGRYIRGLLGSYDHPIKLVRRDELSNMILNTKKPLYYFNYVQSSADKMISVVNGLTGETLYYDFNDKSYRPKPKDFKSLSETVTETR